MKIKKFVSLSLTAGVLLAGGMLLSSNQAHVVQAKSYSKVVTKIAGPHNYAIYHHVSRKGPSGEFTSTSYFRNGQLQSKQYVATKKGNYWKLIVDGRTVGWVNQNFFDRSDISVAKHVGLGGNTDKSFAARDAINFATNSQGTEVNPKSVHVNIVGDRQANFSYGKAHASLSISVSSSKDVDADKNPQIGFRTVSSWSGSSSGSSRNWNAAHHYRSEAKGNAFSSNGLTLRTRLFQPRYVSLPAGQNGDVMGQVGVIPEGISINNGTFVSSVFASSNAQDGHLVSYNLNTIKSKTAAQNLTTMRWSTFKSYTKAIKVSPYIKLGHGQAIGSSASYIYVMANDNSYSNGPKSEEIFQINKSNMQINQIWTFRINGDRYLHNATFAGDNTMYGLFHNGGYGCYEYWKLTRNGDSWNAQEVGATKGNFVNGSPVQGFTYSNGNFFIGFNDNIFKVAENGRAERHYQFHTRRELEGLSADGSNLYAELAQRSELLDGKIR